jgi:hypothetical protein
MGCRSESDYREVAFEREGKEPLHGFMRVDHGMVIVRGYGGHKETRVSSSPPDFIARLLLSELEMASREKRSRPKKDLTEENGS